MKATRKQIAAFVTGADPSDALETIKEALDDEAQMAIEAATGKVWREFESRGFKGHCVADDALVKLQLAIAEYFLVAQGAA
jgi:hypothetical protein